MIELNSSLLINMYPAFPFIPVIYFHEAILYIICIASSNINNIIDIPCACIYTYVFPLYGNGFHIY